MQDITETNRYPALMLAYYGDAVIELMVRREILMSGEASVGSANVTARRYVTLESQSEAFARIEPMLTEGELDVYRRARNHHSATRRHGSAAQYHRATGMEALFGALWLIGDEKRAAELFDTAFGISAISPESEPEKQKEEADDGGEA